MSLSTGFRKALLWPRPSLIFFVTGKCHGRCLHCFSHKLSSKNELTPAQVRDFAIALGPVDDLSISGGEPLLRKDLVELLTPLFEISKPSTCTFPTGGLYPEKTLEVFSELALPFSKTAFTAAFPLEGDKKLHDKIRGVPGGFEKLKKTVNAVFPLIESKIINFKLVTTLSSLNQNHIKKIIRVSKQEFPLAAFHHFEPMRGKGRDPKATWPDADILKENRELIFEHWESYRGFYKKLNALALNAKKTILKIQIDVLKGAPLPFTCRAHEFGMVLYPQGDVAFCEMTPTIGNITNQSLKSILSGAPAKAIIDQIEKGCACTHSCFLPKSLLASPIQVSGIIKKTGARYVDLIKR